MDVADIYTESMNLLQNAKIDEHIKKTTETETINLSTKPDVITTSIKESQRDEEGVIEAVESDADSNIVDVTGTVEEIMQEQIPASTNMNTVIVIEKQQDDCAGSSMKNFVDKKVMQDVSAQNIIVTAEEPTYENSINAKAEKAAIESMTVTPTSLSQRITTEEDVHSEVRLKQLSTKVTEEDFWEDKDEEKERKVEIAKEDGEVCDLSIPYIDLQIKRNYASVDPESEHKTTQETAKTTTELVTNLNAEVTKKGTKSMSDFIPVHILNQQQPQQKQQENLNNMLKEIISDIDIAIEKQKDVTNLKAQKLELLKQQQVLAQQIKLQQLLAQQLAEQNKLQEEQLKQQQQCKLFSGPTSCTMSNATTTANGGMQQNESYGVKETSNLSKKIDLEKIFTPAIDAEEILPKNHYHQLQPKTSSPSIIPAYSDAGKHRVQLNMLQEKMIEKYTKPGLKVVKTPWTAALETGSASTAFVEEHKASPYLIQPTLALSPASVPWNMNNCSPSPNPLISKTSKPGDITTQIQKQPAIFTQTKPNSHNSHRDLAYKPNIPQGWKAPNMSLPKELFIPKEIPLESYAPPPQALSNILHNSTALNDVNENFAPTQEQHSSPSYALGTMQGSTNNCYSSAKLSLPKPQNIYPRSSQNGCYYSSTYVPLKQQHLPPASYRTVQQLTNQTPQVNFNPSPLTYDKLAKFEHTSPLQINTSKRVYSHYSSFGFPDIGLKVCDFSPYDNHPISGASQECPMDQIRKAALNNETIVPNYRTQNFSRPPSQLHCTYSAKEGCENKLSEFKYKINTTDLSHCQNFNSAARGWGSIKNSTVFLKPMIVAGNLPYSDF